MIDLRSDTVTLPTPEMRAAMAEAPLGDDQFGEDPTRQRLQERVAALLGKEAGLFAPTGTMANQLPLKLSDSPGDDVVVGAESHAVWHETGAAAANAGVQFTEAGTRRALHGRRAERRRSRAGTCCSRRPRSSRSRTRTTGGRPGRDRAELECVGAAAREHGAASYLDGARLLNAAAARGEDPADAGRAVRPRLDRALEGARLPRRLGARRPRDDVAALVRYRRMLGGAMRQVGRPRRRGRSTRSTTTSSGCRGPRQRARLAERLAAVDGVGSTSTGADEHRRLPARRRGAGRRHRRRASARAGTCSSWPSRSGRSAP